MSYYVISKDKFMSGWGRAEGKENWCICECDSMKDAERVKAYAESRGDQEKVYITEHAPLKLFTADQNEEILLSSTDGWVERSKRDWR